MWTYGNNRVYFNGILREMQNVRSDPGNAFARVPPYPRWGEKYGPSARWIHSWPGVTISCNLWVSGYLVWWKEKFKNLFPSPEYNKIGLARWFGIPWVTLFLPKSRASEIPHSTDIQSTFAELARPDLKLRVCHLPAAWAWGNNWCLSILSCPRCELGTALLH